MLFLSQKRGKHQDYILKKSRSKGNTLLFQEGQIMREHYDFSKMKGKNNPFAKKLKKQISIRIGVDTLDYFKKLAEETGVPYQNLIDSYLADCANKHRKTSDEMGVNSRFPS